MNETPVPPQHESERQLQTRTRAEQRWRLLSRASWLIATIVASIVVLGLPPHLAWVIRLCAGWNAGVITLLGCLWAFILQSDPSARAVARRRRTLGGSWSSPSRSSPAC